MLVLTETTDNLQVVLAGSVVANQLRCMSSWRDITTSAYTPGRTVTNTNNTTDVNVVPAPASSTQRVVDFLSIYNQDTGSATVTIKLDANGTEYILFKAALASGEAIQYTDNSGFFVVNTAGAVKQSINQGTSPTSAAFSTATLASNVINNNAVANTIASVTGLSFPVLSTKIYTFEFNILYDAAATTTGSRWSITGPAFSKLIYTSEYTLTSTTSTRNAMLNAYDLPAASNATSASISGGNFATIYGFIVPSADGDVTARFASEVASSAITALAGSYVRYQQMT